MIVAVPRFLWRLLRENGSMSLDEAVWDGTYLGLPDSDREAQYRNIFTAETTGAAPQGDGKPGLALSGIFSSFPVALLVRVEPPALAGQDFSRSLS
jgi:maltooligosyltrehalose synthase